MCKLWNDLSDDASSATSIDLREVVGIALNTKSGKEDFGRFDVDTGERVHKFKARTAAEAEQWVARLEAWREYFLLSI